MTTTANAETVTITREQLPNGKYRYTFNGKVDLKAATKLYTHASLYGNEEGRTVPMYHTRLDLAIKGHQVLNACVAYGTHTRRGWVEITAI